MTAMHEISNALERIGDRDPDGDEFRTTKPTKSDYAAHQQWAIETYGQIAWNRYCGYTDDGSRKLELEERYAYLYRGQDIV